MNLLAGLTARAQGYAPATPGQAFVTGNCVQPRVNVPTGWLALFSAVWVARAAQWWGEDDAEALARHGP